MNADSSCLSRQSGEQTTLHDGPLGVFMSWLRRPYAHESATSSKGNGPSSGLEDEGVEPVTLLQWTRGVGKHEVGESIE